MPDVTPRPKRPLFNVKPPRWVCRSKHFLARTNGRRGAFQFLFAMVYAMLGISFAIALDFPPALAWMGVLGAEPPMLAPLWGVSALIGVAGAFLPRPKDSISFAALTVAPCIGAGLYLIGALVSPVGTSLLGIIMYLALAGAVMVVSGMTGDRDRDDRKTG